MSQTGTGMPNVDRLREPETEYRTRNYWGWLENITPEETVWQIDRMHEAGLGGYVMHARGGLTIPYAGDQWMDSVKAMIRRGRELGMVTIIDDEHGWPSGFGAGKVNGKGKEYQLKYLLCEEIRAGEAGRDECTLGLWTKEYAPVEKPEALPPEETLIRVYKRYDPYYVDNMDPRVVEAFIEASYQDYLDKLGTFDGVYGIFSDEPQTARYATPWSDILPELYEKEEGEALLPQLVKLFYPAPGCERVRVKVYRLMERCFAENYAGKLRKWCEERGVAFTGHTCLEEDLVGQLRCSIGTMPFYRNMTVPGVDWLTRTAVRPLNTLQLTSAAQQTGKKRVLCEMFGCAGWNVSLEEMKWIAQMQAALGINDHLQHLGLYSLRGSRKREYPASLHYQQPWFAKYRPYNDYFARVCKLIAESRMETDVLVIHPMESVWAAYDGSEKSCEPLQKGIDMTLETLLEMGVSPHLGDEALMRMLGRAEGHTLIVGECRYEAVLLPDICAISSDTARLLKEYSAGGGRVVCAGDAPRLIDGVPGTLDIGMEKIEMSPEGIRGAFEAPVRAAPGKGLYVTRWDWQGQRFLYVVNNDLHACADFRLEAEGCWYEYDPETGDMAKEPVDAGRMHLEGGQAVILFAGPRAPIPSPLPPARETVKLEGEWRVAACTENALTLDHCRLSFDGETWEDEEYILDIQKRLMKEEKNREVYLKFSFISEEGMELFLLAEDVEKCAFTLNGEKVSSEPALWRVDKCLKALPARCKRGENQLVVRRMFVNPERVYYVKNHAMHEAESNRVTVETELEAVYLWGDFGVYNLGAQADGPRRTAAMEGPFVLGKRPEAVEADRLEAQGFPFFAGTVALEKTAVLPRADRAVLAFDRPDAIVTGVYVNGSKVKDFCWAPYRADVTDLVREGENTIRVEITNSCRNLFGPHYSREGESYAVGPMGFGKDVPHKQFVRLGVEGLRIEIG